MTTKLIGIKEFRQNITQIWKEARAKNIRFIVMYHSKPVMEINPINEKEFILENLEKDILEARVDVKKGNVYSHEEVLAELGL
ncbi:hypothetical protein COV81_01405 [Candidatus Peregrinibacteria bacterium CG11_big_fil_rev_8_21_14_0_20_41_10]|nr:MAG: hypothetical protein COV81_01405 [Candidatus Peregrinibacteria bacterium CG11_big_fil_rev_8_21_14_0_20_41_10]PIZ76369.1 MAG: hypothetical protein COY06_01925 [Candidatus Peregrinibacteria bacterium CG_4_10_14_0_2_um_filter_41_8]PJC38139.1 MAG: hypothetical protein CO045_01830 [Candidatus Peregrinibacteria bacterium CG_4_9_14_0_2_um_filter_41_14]